MTFPALLAHSSPPLRLWRFAGVVFLVAQAISDSLSLRDTWKAKHIVEQCLLDGAPRIVDGVECNRCITKAWQKAARSRRPFHFIHTRRRRESLRRVVCSSMLLTETRRAGRGPPRAAVR